MAIDVDIQFAVDDQPLPDADEFQRWVEIALVDQLDEAELCIRIVSSEESQELNSTWRGKDKPTNVLSFPFEAPPGFSSAMIGDLAICAEVVATEAKEQNKPLKAHWAHMVIHGVLHLIGFDHINDEDAEEMEALEIKLLAQLDIPNPYISA
ncbi:MAG: rRNA maturation RNase YbeY [Oceanospirillales bacterium]|jgi:probable rRNA maturation factor|nr:MAG: rRNA maturation RNase YbeY [Oceanospirillales bacterium]